MKIFLTFISCIMWLASSAQQEKRNTFHLVDTATNKPLTVSVSIVRAKLAITTENDGVFMIPGDLKLMTDTIIFSVQNYDQLKMSLKALEGLDTLRLSKAILKNNYIKSTFLKDTLLNDFEDSDVVYFAGLHQNGEGFNYLQLAQRFDIDKTNSRLDAIQLNRLSFNINTNHDIVNNDKMYDYLDIEYTKFKVRIYDIDPATGKPGKDLCTDIIEIKIADSKKARIDLKKYNIIIPNKTFFVAVEWMRDYYNAHYTYVFNYKRDAEKIISYKPAIGILPISNKNLNIWAMDTSRNWIPYDTFSPFGTDLAIKAKVAYN
ncbi:hypothetical protein [Pedobacter sp. B4-66]|uniref:hypothetical protein n=1 Tax=Pedobacter sp. B4-66 TaxID=2817280 RepID=UPI001BDA2A28|nr:hypothetical protein [Pedobacter sp. B4-66]